MKKPNLILRLCLLPLGLALVGLSGIAEVDRERDVGAVPSHPTAVVTQDDVRLDDVTSPIVPPATPDAGPEGVYYSLVWYSINNGGSTELASASYSAGVTVGPPAGPLNSASYSAYLGFWQPFSAGSGCCIARVGDANGIGGDEPTIGDVSTMIDAKFITGYCTGLIDCFEEADINQSGGTSPTCDDITISDISTLIDYLFITGSSLGLADCL